MAGWISLHRKLMDNPIYSNANMLKLWVHCLLKASHVSRKQLVGKQLVDLEKGQFVTGRFELSNEFNKGVKKDEMVNDRTLWRWVKTFEEWEMLSIKSTTKYSVITVLNWSEYQGDDQQMTNKSPSNVQPVSTNNNGNKGNKDNKKDSSRKRVYDADSPEFKIAEFFFKEIQKNNPNHKEPNLQNWANDVRLMLEIDKRDKSELSSLIRWVQQDDFEMSNVLSPAKLRKRYDALVMKMKQKNASGNIIQMPSKPVKEFELDVTKGES